MKYFVTGAAGFIGSHVVDDLLEKGHEVVGFDNLSTGFRQFLTVAQKHPHFRLVEGDLLDERLLAEAMRGCEFVFHLAANADVREGLKFPRRDLEQNTLATFNVLEVMRRNLIKKIAFSSTGSIYGEATVIPTPEDAPFPVQTSLYGASKLSGEGLIAAFCEGYAFQAWIFRFVSILGERYSHGHVFDFFKQLKAHPDRLKVLGNGQQKKSYLHVKDCVAAMNTAIARAHDKINIFNLGTDEYCEVRDSVGWICETLRVNPSVELTGGDRGWIGDNPFIFLDTRRIRGLGWRPQLSIRESVIKTVEFLEKNRFVIEERS